MPSLPPPRTPGRYAVALVCLGNICRSPMADVVLSDRIDAARLGDRVVVNSSGTGPWHVGRPMDARAAAALTAAGLDPSRHVARQFAASWYAEHDLVLTMDRANLAEVRSLLSGEDGVADRVRLFRDFDPAVPSGGSTGAEVPDPYYGGNDGFQEVLSMVTRTADAIVAELSAVLGRAADR